MKGDSQPKLFISYSRKNGEVADRLDTIFRILRLQVWWDDRVSAGELWEEKIKANLGTAECILVVWSMYSVTSKWVLFEANEGYRRGVLLNLKIDDCEIPEPFADIETFDFSSRVESLTINDVLTRELLRRIGEISGSDFWVDFESNDRGTL